MIIFVLLLYIFSQLINICILYTYKHTRLVDPFVCAFFISNINGHFIQVNLFTKTHKKKIPKNIWNLINTNE